MRGDSVWIEVAAPPPVEARSAAHLETLASIVLAQSRGAIVFHGSAVDGERGSVVLLAPTQGGKSTAAAMLLKAGYRFRSDDVSVVEPVQRIVFDAPPTVALRAGAASSPRARRRAGHRRAGVDQNRRGCPEQGQFAAFVSLEWGDPRLDPVPLEARWPRLYQRWHMAQQPAAGNRPSRS